MADRFAQFTLTDDQIDPTSTNLSQYVDENFGSSARLARWSEVASTYQEHGDAFLSAIGMTNEDDGVNGAHVSRDGSATWDDTGRYYFSHWGDVGTNFLSHEQVGSGNDALHLGSWDGSKPVFVDLNGSQPNNVANLSKVTINGTTLEGQDADGGDLWTFESSSTWNRAKVVNLDGDDDNEVIAGTKADGSDKGEVYALDHQGNKLWQFQMGAEGSESPYWPDDNFRVNQLEATDVDGDGSKEVVAAAYQHPYYPGRLATLSSDDGALEGEYWHPGRKIHFAVEDIDGNGTPDIIGASTNNDQESGGKVSGVFRLEGDNLSGEAPPNLGEFAAGSELWYSSHSSSENPQSVELREMTGDEVTDVAVQTANGEDFYMNGATGELIEPTSSEDSESSETHYDEDFENTALGRVPEDLEVRFGGEEVGVVEDPAGSTDKVFKVEGASNWVATVYRPEPAPESDRVVEGEIYPTHDGSQSDSHVANFMFNRAGFHIHNEDTTTSSLEFPNGSTYGGVKPSEWHDFQLKMDYDNNKYSVFWDGRQVHSASFDPDQTQDQFQNLRLHGHGQDNSRKAYFDDLEIRAEDVSVGTDEGEDASTSPDASADSAGTSPGEPVAIDVLANDSHPESDTLTLSNVGDPSHGTASISDGAINYVPESNYTGTDSFDYTITDESGETAVAEVSVTVQDQAEGLQVRSGLFDNGSTFDEALVGPSEAEYFKIFDADTGGFLTGPGGTSREGNWLPQSSLSQMELDSGEYFVQAWDGGVSDWTRFSTKVGEQDSYLGHGPQSLPPNQKVTLDQLVNTEHLKSEAYVKVYTAAKSFDFMPAEDLANHNWTTPAEGQTRPVWVDTWLSGEGRSGWTSMDVTAEESATLVGTADIETSGIDDGGA